MGKYGSGLYGSVLRDFLSNSYKSNQAKTLDGYKRDESLSGRRAQVYHNPTSNQTIVAHRGTQGLQDWLTDFKLAFFPSMYMQSTRYKHAKDIQNQTEAKYGKENIITTGHSLGAKLASDLGGKSKEIITYNKPILPQDLLNQTKKTRQVYGQNWIRYLFSVQRMLILSKFRRRLSIQLQRIIQTNSPGSKTNSLGPEKAANTSKRYLAISILYALQKRDGFL